MEGGTGRRALGSVVLNDGRTIPVGGKTGTGDNRLHVYGSRGALLGSSAVNRTAAFVFFIGDRFFGTVVAYVPGAQAAHYTFTSALPIQVFRQLVPKLRPLLDREIAAANPASGLCNLPFSTITSARTIRFDVRHKTRETSTRASCPCLKVLHSRRITPSSRAVRSRIVIP